MTNGTWCLARVGGCNLRAPETCRARLASGAVHGARNVRKSPCLTGGHVHSKGAIVPRTASDRYGAVIALEPGRALGAIVFRRRSLHGDHKTGGTKLRFGCAFGAVVTERAQGTGNPVRTVGRRCPATADAEITGSARTWNL